MKYERNSFFKVRTKTMSVLAMYLLTKGLCIKKFFIHLLRIYIPLKLNKIKVSSLLLISTKMFVLNSRYILLLQIWWPFSDFLVKIETNSRNNICKYFMLLHNFNCALFSSNCAANHLFFSILLTLRAEDAFTGSNIYYNKSYVTHYRCLFNYIIEWCN